MLKINNIDSTKPTGRYKNKKQIMITHTGRNLSDYVKSLKSSSDREISLSMLISVPSGTSLNGLSGAK